jgi:hypothetical protein
MKKRHDSILSVVHETAKGLHSAGIMDGMSMCKFDALCLPLREDVSATGNQTDTNVVSRQSGGLRYLSEREQNICGKLGVRREKTRSYGRQTS